MGYVRRLETEQDNLRAAMDWAKAGGRAELGLRLVCAIADFWRIRGQCSEGQRRVEGPLAINGVVDGSLRARALAVAGALAKLRGDLAQAIALHEESLVTAREAHDARQIAHTSRGLGLAVGAAGDLERARALLEESLRLSRELKMARAVGIATHLLAWIVQQQGHLDQAWDLCEESLSAFRELGDIGYVAQVHEALGELALQRGELEQAKAFLLESLLLAEQVGFADVRFRSLEAMAMAAVRGRNPGSAARFLAAARVARAVAGEVLEPAEQAKLQETEEAGRAQLGEAGWNRAWQEGRALPFEDALALARAYAGEQHYRGDGAALHQRQSPDSSPHLPYCRRPKP